MADYEGRVRITADTSDADRKLRNFVKSLDRPVDLAIRTAGFIQAQQSLSRLQRSIGDLNKTPLNILTGFGAGSSERQDKFRQLSKSAKDFFNSVAAGEKQLASTTAGLRQQAAAFQNLADNISFADRSQRRFFRDFTQGAEIARTKASAAGIEQLRALQDLYQSNVGGFKQDISPRTGGLNQLLNLGKDLPRTKAALTEYRAELERVYDLVETRSLSGGIVAVEISNVEKELLKIEQDRVEANDQINNVKKASYALTGKQLALEEENLASIERQFAARVRAQRAAVDLYNRDKSLSRDFGVNPAMALRPSGVSDEEVALRNLISTQSRLNAIEEENLAAVERRIGARQAEVAVANELVKVQRQQAVDLYNRDRTLSRDFGVSPEMALRPSGVSDEEVALRNLISTQSRLNAIEEENLAAVERRIGARQREIEVANQLVREQRQQAVDLYNRDRALSRDFGVSPAMTLRPAGVSDAQVERQNLFDDLAREREATVERIRANQSSARGRAAELRRTQGLSFEERLARLRPDLAPGGQKPGKGFLQGSPRKAIGEGLIGGAFPLLFGQGAAASVGGLAGGVTGGLIGGSFGFGLSLIGTALGQAVDDTTNSLKELAASLKSPTDAIAALEASGFRVGDSLKLQVQQLQSVGRAYDAQTLVLAEVQKRLGPGAITELKELDTAQKRLQEQWGAIAAEIQTRLLPVLQGFVEFLGSAAGDIGGLASQSRLQRLDPETFEQLRGQAIRETSRGPLGMFGDKRAYDTRLNELAQQELSRRFAGERSQIQLSPQEALADEKTRIDESRRLADQIQSAYREAFKLQRQANDLQREGATINKEIADYAYKKESEIFNLRQQAAEKEIENRRASAQNRIERGDLNLRESFAAATGFEQQLLSNVREVMRTRMEGEADIEQSRRKLELTMAKLNRDTEDYKRTTAREIEDIERRKLSYTRSVEDYRMQVADYVLQRSRESADLMRQAMTLPEVGGGAMGGGLAPYAAVSPLQRIPYMTEIDKAAKTANVDPRLFAGLVRQESNFRPNAVSGSGAIGLAQLMPGTAGELGVNPRDIQQNLMGGARYLRQMIDMFGSVEAGLRAYNQGPGAQRRTPGGNSAESRAYPGSVLGFARQYGYTPTMGAAPGPAMPGGVIARTGATGIGTGAHLDVRWADGRPITSADADRFIRVAGKSPSSFGVSSGYGPRRAPVPGASTFHRGIDFPTPAGLPISLTGGARLTGSMTEAQSGGGGIVGIIDTPMGQMKLLHLEKIIGNVQAGAAGQISNIARPGFSPVPLGATPTAAPINADRMAVLARITGGEQEAQKILEEQLKLRQKGVELGQIEQILQNNQLPQLEQQGDTLRRQIEARRQILDLSDQNASVADIEAESAARLAQIEKDRVNALAKIKQSVTDPKQLTDATAQVNRQAGIAARIAGEEEKQRRKNLDLNNQLQNQERARSEILQLQEGLAFAKVEAAALERGELEASSVELLKASQLYRDSEQAQRDKLEALTAETEELRKQSEFRKRINEGQRDIGLVGAGLRAGLVGTGARAFEQGMRDFDGDTDKAMQFANQAKAAEDAQLMWGRLEQNIVDVSEAISGGLTNGLLGIIDGSRKIEDVGREMLSRIAGTFAESAQQQLSTLMQRKLGGMLGGPEGMLTKLVGGGTEAAGAQALGAASMSASGSVLAFGAALQAVTAQMALSGAMSGVGSTFAEAAPSLLGSAIPGLLPGFSPGAFSFGGFFANGGVTKPGEGYVVGEKEPEFFFPGVTGRVVPRSDMEKAQALRDDNQESEPIDLRYTVTEQRGERYVTEEQFRKGMAATSRRAQVATLASMRNSKEVRGFVDI